ncbi:hypothetical protein SLEP1_g53902 [Rubroshorea leprosula]|uniref:Reverse transcriptase domain-containing protein n=1 Tax=Rubroshorea leprosula TaxID=152421 RepID=A0AAV5MAP5_9ROSI|nr:hypothetical protein SLEP1_g53902 [Rubroshorea leprosula]
MEKRLNGIWFGLHKLRVKVVEDRQKRFFANQRKTRVAVARRKEEGQLGSAIAILCPSCCRKESKFRKAICGRSAGQSFGWCSGGNKWLDGSMVAEVRSLALITVIQARLDVDGGCITLSPLGVSVGEVIVVYDDTKTKAILCDGDQKSTSEAELEYSSSLNMDEDLELMNYEIQGADAGTMNKEVLKEAMGDDVGPNKERIGGVDEVGPNKERIGPRRGEFNGLKDDVRADEVWTNGQGNEKGIRVGQCSKRERVNAANTKEIRPDCELGSSVLLGRKQRDLEDYCLQNWLKIEEVSTQWVTGRSKQREGRRKKAQQAAEERVVRAGSGSFLDRCITHRNQVIQREMNLNEVKKMLSVGKSVRGLGGMVKRKEMDRLIRIEKPGFLFLQQTKLEKVDDRLCRSMWNSDGCDWIMKESKSASRGLLCVWDKMKFVKKGEFTSDRVANGRKAQNSITGIFYDGMWVEEPEVEFYQHGSHKLLAKVLANRLKTVMSNIISDTQSSFLGECQLVDSVLTLNEVVDEARRRKQQAFVLKADVEKAYDYVDWSFSNWMMDKFGFGSQWRGWIKECLFTVRVSILVNGSPTVEFQMEKGLSIQRDFLWGGAELKRKIPWVKWEYVCYSKEKGGLGVSDLSIRNWALLGKWWYRFGESLEHLWKKVIREKYYKGRQEVAITAVEDWKVSRVWGDVMRIRGIFVQLREMLAKGFRWGVGDEMGESMVGKMGFWEGDKWCWRLEWRKGKMGRERDGEKLLWEVLGKVRLKQQKEDCWKWAHDPKGRHVVKMAYEFLAPREGVLQGQLCKLVWCKLVPSKVAFFGWRLCLDRLPTKLNLEKKRGESTWGKITV